LARVWLIYRSFWHRLYPLAEVQATRKTLVVQVKFATKLAAMVFLNATLPMFALLFAGFFAVRRGYLTEGGIKGLALFAFYFAMPVFLFRTMANLSLADGLDARFFIHYLAAGICTYLIGMGIGRFVFGAQLTGQAIFGMSACFGNLAIIALPIVIDVFGEKATLPITMLVLLEAAVYMPVTIIILEVLRSREGAVAGAGLPRAVGKGVMAVITNAVIMSMLIGILFSYYSIPIPTLVDEFASLVGSAGIPCSLFALGASLARIKRTDKFSESAVMTGVKLILYPLLVFGALSLLPAPDPIWVATAVLAACMPMGANLYLVAETFNAHVGRASMAVLTSTIVSALTVSIAAAILAGNL